MPLPHAVKIQEIRMSLIRSMLMLALLGGTAASTTGCTTAIVAGAAAAGGYIAHEKGYRIRNPVTRDSDADGG